MQLYGVCREETSTQCRGKIRLLIIDSRSDIDIQTSTYAWSDARALCRTKAHAHAGTHVSEV